MASPTTERRGRSFLAPVIGGLVSIGALVVLVYFRSDVWQATKWTADKAGAWVTDWVPNHPAQTTAIGVFALVAAVINFFSHVSGRLRSWIFAIVVEAGLWLLFWYGLLIPSFNELLGLNLERMPLNQVLLAGGLVIGLTGLIFWLLEAREGWRRYRHGQDVEAAG
jgi:hypothetical protein